MRKTAVDTNVLVRVLITLETEQSRIATKLISSQQIFVANTVLLETEWVLRSVVRASRAEINERFRDMLRTQSIIFERPEVVARALDLHRHGMDFADALHVCGLEVGDQFLTFDQDLVKLAQRHVDDIDVQLAVETN